ncbi:MAG: hypothetical protein IPP10_18820 [Candidatus Competibacteraceae bacterium]|nr:hypothetical protein [Candidatus Competibacteraceae bacterium]
MAPVVLEFMKYQDDFKCIVVVTAQSPNVRSSSKSFEIKPDYDLNIMSDGQTLKTLTILILEGLEKIFVLGIRFDSSSW